MEEILSALYLYFLVKNVYKSRVLTLGLPKITVKMINFALSKSAKNSQMNN